MAALDCPAVSLHRDYDAAVAVAVVVAVVVAAVVVGGGVGALRAAVRQVVLMLVGSVRFARRCVRWC